MNCWWWPTATPREASAWPDITWISGGCREENLLKIFVTDEETCSRADYDQLIARPVREKLAQYSLAKRPRCVVTVKGVPLRIRALPLTKVEQSEIDGLKAERERLNGQLSGISDEAGKKAGFRCLVHC